MINHPFLAHEAGLGCKSSLINVYIGNVPAMTEYQSLTDITPVIPGEIHAIGQALGNGWRKVFNVYAKLIFALDDKQFDFRQQADSWQQWRDNFLLQTDSNTSLRFSPPQLDSPSHQRAFHIIMGRTYAKQLVADGLLNAPLNWLNEEFAINEEHHLVVCPYFDYRQLSNVKIATLVNLIRDFEKTPE